jgi:hypothetical protein
MVEKLIRSPTTYPFGCYVEFTGRLAPHSQLAQRSGLCQDLFEELPRIIVSRKAQIAVS